MAKTKNPVKKTTTKHTRRTGLQPGQLSLINTGFTTRAGERRKPSERVFLGPSDGQITSEKSAPPKGELLTPHDGQQPGCIVCNGKAEFIYDPKDHALCRRLANLVSCQAGQIGTDSEQVMDTMLAEVVYTCPFCANSKQCNIKLEDSAGPRQLLVSDKVRDGLSGWAFRRLLECGIRPEVALQYARANIGITQAIELAEEEMAESVFNSLSNLVQNLSKEFAQPRADPPSSLDDLRAVGGGELLSALNEVEMVFNNSNVFARLARLVALERNVLRWYKEQGSTAISNRHTYLRQVTDFATRVCRPETASVVDIVIVILDKEIDALENGLYLATAQSGLECPRILLSRFEFRPPSGMPAVVSTLDELVRVIDSHTRTDEAGAFEPSDLGKNTDECIEIRTGSDVKNTNEAVIIDP